MSLFSAQSRLSIIDEVAEVMGEEQWSGKEREMFVLHLFWEIFLIIPHSWQGRSLAWLGLAPASTFSATHTTFAEEWRSFISVIIFTLPGY